MAEDTLISAVVTEQIFMRCLCAVLLEREVSRHQDRSDALRAIVEEAHIAIDCYAVEFHMSQRVDEYKELARVLVDGIAVIAEKLGKIE